MRKGRFDGKWGLEVRMSCLQGSETRAHTHWAMNTGGQGDGAPEDGGQHEWGAARVPPASVITSARPLNMALSMESCAVRVRSVV